MALPLAPLAQQLLDDLGVTDHSVLWAPTGNPALDLVNRQLGLHISQIDGYCRQIDTELDRLATATTQMKVDMAAGKLPHSTTWVDHYGKQVAERTTQIHKAIEAMSVLTAIRVALTGA